VKVLVSALVVLFFGSFANSDVAPADRRTVDTAYIDTMDWNIGNLECRAVSMRLTITEYPDSNSWDMLSMNVYSRREHEWILMQHIDTLDGTYFGGELSLLDLNGDAIEDILLYYGTGARGSNELYYLFRSDSTSHRLVLQNDGNALVNPSLDTVHGYIETVAFTGSTTYERFRLVNNDLVEVARREVWQEDSVAYQLKTRYQPDGSTIETLDSMKSEDEYWFDWGDR
jgi:hypothetical protein